MRISDWSSDVCSSDLFDGDDIVRLVVFPRPLDNGKQAPAVGEDVLLIGPQGLGLLPYEPTYPVSCFLSADPCRLSLRKASGPDLGRSLGIQPATEEKPGRPHGMESCMWKGRSVSEEPR